MTDQLHNREAEQSVIGGLFLDHQAIDDVASILTAGDFAEERHQVTYTAMLALYEQGQPLDVVTVAEHLQSRELLERVGEIGYLLTLARDTPSAANITAYAGIVRDYSIRRQLVAAGGRIADLGRSAETAKVARDQANALLSALDDTEKGGGPVFVAELLKPYLEDLDARHERGGDILGVSTGLDNLDTKINGLCPGRLYIVAGRPAMGKSVLGGQIALTVARGNQPALVFTLEMPASEYLDRVMASYAGITMDAIQQAQMDDGDWGRITAAVGDIRQFPLLIDDGATLSIADLRARARRMHRRTPLGVIVVDYVGLMQGEKSETRAREMGTISQGLKRLAKELHVPVVALAQLNRELERRQNKRPVLSDLRESGDLEQDADCVLFLYRDEVYDRESVDKGMAEIIIGKQRNGPIGMVPAVFEGQYSRFKPGVGMPSWNSRYREDEI